MNQFNYHTTLTDDLERELIQQEISRQMSFAPVFDFKRIADRVAALFGYVRADSSLNSQYAVR